MLRRHGASIYVGDHVHDVEGARAAGITSVSVLTGGCTREELEEAGTDVVLADLDEFPDWLDAHVLERRLARPGGRILRGHGRVIVAFSGGADSAFLLAAAVRALGPQQVAAATAYSDSLPMAERGPAREFAQSLGVRAPDAARPHELEREGYRSNDGDRCAFCKAELLEVLGPLAREHGYDVVATGTNADDAGAGFRPGIAAASDPRRRDAAPRRGADQGAGAGRLAGVGAADLGQAGRRLPELPDRLRHRDHPGRAGAGRAGRGRAQGGPGGRRPRGRRPAGP